MRIVDAVFSGNFMFEFVESAKLRALRAHVPMCLACLRAHVPTCLACLRAHVLCVLTCQCALRA